MRHADPLKQKGSDKMTWQEFVQKVEEELKALADKDPELFYIDTGNYPDAEDLHVRITDEGLDIASWK